MPQTPDTSPPAAAVADPHADWLARAVADLRQAGDDPVETERRLDRALAEGRARFEGDMNLCALFSALRLPAVPDGTAADARLRRRQKLSEAAYGATLRAEAWQSSVLYLCDPADGRRFWRLHARTLAILEDPAWDGVAMDAARWAVSTYIAEEGLEPDLDAPVPSMEEVQRKFFGDLGRNLEAYEAVLSEDRAG